MKTASRVFFILMLSFLTSVLKGQRHGSLTPPPVTAKAHTFGFATEQGTWELQSFPHNISKTIFRPNGYTRSELISNAVILKPTVQKMVVGQDLRQDMIKLNETVKVARRDKELWFYFDDQPTAVLTKTVQRDGFHGFSFRLLQDEKIFGGGERALPLDRRGHSFNLYNNPWYGYEYGADNLNFSVPFFISSKGYGIFFDNASKGYADIGKNDTFSFEAGFVSGELNFYVIPGKNIDQILQSYTALTGRQAIPPRWVLGNFMSRFGYRSEEQVKEVFAAMKEEKFPVDAVIFDLFWFGDSIKGTMGNLDWVNKEKWPDPAGMIAGLKKENAKTILITEPFVLKSTPNYQPSKQYHTIDSNGNPYVLTDFYFGEGGLIDIFRKDAQNWFWSKYQQQIQNGVAGWWGDLGEPEKHPSETFHNLQDLGFNRRFSADEVHNLYGHYWSKMLHEKYAAHYPSTRLFHLNRSGFAGSQRYNVFPWTGDVHRNWNGFKAQLPLLLSMSLSGIPYIHSDAGGFAMGQKDPELYTRWLQFAAFTPVFRPHGTAFGDVDPGVLNIESEPVFYPEPYRSIVRNIIRLRYDLTPYNYSLAYEQQQSGRPLMRPMFYHHSEPENYDAAGQYLWGEHILVAPVFDQQSAEKRVFLPKGDWYNFPANQMTKGGEWKTVEAGIEDILFFVKEGAFIPMVKGLNNLESYSTAELEVLYVPSSLSTSYTLYDDDGKTKDAVAKKQFELVTFSGRREKNKISIAVSTNGGKFNGRPSSRNIRFNIPGLDRKPSKISVNGKNINTFSFDADTKMLQVDVKFASHPVRVQVEW
ncbi:MAG TPA: TIM-barrel domain-containing protein [Chitinophagaceae bacterium]|nr:TIM-barrel domain-containing protein [Chitinophagaceae bacterium]